MGINKVNILSTRPVGKILVAEAASHNITIDEISFIETRKNIDDNSKKKIEELSKKNINAVFTSMNALNAIDSFVDINSSWKIFCIGNTTKDLAVNIFGKENILGAADNAAALSEKIIATPGVSKAYFFCGNLRRDELPENLKEHGIEVEELTVYHTSFTPQHISKDYDGILFFSPSAVESFFLKNDVVHNTKFFAIGKTTAEALRLFTDQSIIIAAKPGKKKPGRGSNQVFLQPHLNTILNFNRCTS